MRAHAPAPINVDVGCVGSGLSKVLGSPERPVVASALECLGGTASVSEILALTGLERKKIRAVLGALEFGNLLARRHAVECQAGLTAEGRELLADYRRAMGTLSSEIVARKSGLGSEA